jgi:hypothetical protein
MPQVPVSTMRQSAFAGGPAAGEQAGLVTTAILGQCCLIGSIYKDEPWPNRFRTIFRLTRI